MLVRDGELSIVLASAKVGNCACEVGRVDDFRGLNPEVRALRNGTPRPGPSVIRVPGFERVDSWGVGGGGFTIGACGRC